MWCPAGTLLDYVRGGPDGEYPRLFRQLASALLYMHETAHVVHRDLKLENVMIDEMGGVRVGDFGLAKAVGGLSSPYLPPSSSLMSVVDEDEASSSDDSDSDSDLDERGVLHRAMSVSTPHTPPHAHLLVRHKTVAPPHGGKDRRAKCAPGSVPYAAPELFLPSPPTPTPARLKAADVWALGVILFALAEGRLPFSDAFEPRLVLKIRHGDIPCVSGGLGEGEGGTGTGRVVKGCLEREVGRRWGVREVWEGSWEVGGGEEGGDVNREEEGYTRRGRSPGTTSERGRGRDRDRGTTYSRSASPSVLPATPVDLEVPRLGKEWEEEGLVVGREV